MKFFALAALLITVMISSIANAQVQEVEVTSPPYTPPPSGPDYQTPGAPSSGNNFMGQAAQAAAMAAGMAAAKQECLNKVKEQLNEICQTKATAIHDKATTKCNSITLSGAGATAAVVVGSLYLTGPPGWLVGGLIAIGASGGIAVEYGQSSCKDAVTKNDKYNAEVGCPTYVKNGQTATCPQ